jgi:HK97 family phage major capsid protein
MGSYVTRKAGEVFVQNMNAVIMNGSGIGQPLGILNSGALVTVSKEGSQVADTIHGLNIIKMWARMSPNSRKTAVWCVNPDAVPQLIGAGLQIKSADGATAVGGSLVYIPANVSGKPFDTLMGRPVLYLQDCAALGDLGDIVFANFGNYALIEREGGMRADASIHLFFDQDVRAFRFVYRVNGQPWAATPTADKNGSTTRSDFIALEAR